MFTKSEWIWLDKEYRPDTYVDFVKSFTASGKTLLRIAADSNYVAYVNGRLASFGQYADYPDYKIYDEIDITDLLKDGANVIAVKVWYLGNDCFTYIKGDAGLIFEIEDGLGICAASGTDVLCRSSVDYIGGECREISGQLGFTYHADLLHEDDGYLTGQGLGSFTNAAVIDTISKDLTKRPVKKLVLKQRVSSKMVMQGFFKYNGETGQPQVDMQHADISVRFADEIGTGSRQFPHSFNDNGKNVFFIVDLGKEVSGALDFEITVPEQTRMEVGYGEHLKDGRCRTSIRNFTAQFELRPGKNKFLNLFRRFGCRYIQFFIHSHAAQIEYAGLRPTEYPVDIKKPKLSNLLRNTVYEVCENTLLQCMHEHYEDCPWREQALYTMDSRNQMLCGYYAFKEFEFARACLKLISKGMRKDGILTLCYPAGADYPIPSFSLMYFIQVKEYTEHSGDITLAQEVYPVLERLMKTFTDKLCDNGLCDNFKNSDCGAVWNFYEWSDTMSGADGNAETSYEAPLNADLSLAMQAFSYICDRLCKRDEAEKYLAMSKALNDAIYRTFYNSDTKLFRTFDDKHFDTYSVLTNSLCLLCGAADNADKSRILEMLSTNGGNFDGIKTVPNTLSMNSFRFDALLMADRAKYRDVILDEIDRDYLYMLRNGATSFWETINGDEDFYYAGSLCHGWSALPIYYYEILNG